MCRNLERGLGVAETRRVLGRLLTLPCPSSPTLCSHASRLDTSHLPPKGSWVCCSGIQSEEESLYKPFPSRVLDSQQELPSFSLKS